MLIDNQGLYTHTRIKHWGVVAWRGNGGGDQEENAQKLTVAKSMGRRTKIIVRKVSE